MEWMEEYLNEAERMITDDRVEEGVRLLDSLLYEEPGSESLHNHLGWAHMYYTQNMKKAELHLTMSLRFNAAYAPPYLHLGQLCNRMARYSEAIGYFEKGLSIPGANRTALMEGLAFAYEMKNEFRAAIRHYREAVASASGYELQQLSEGIKRCRSKRWIRWFG
jgi:tetratricopeptide (TPR) repeat protein